MGLQATCFQSRDPISPEAEASRTTRLVVVFSLAVGARHMYLLLWKHPASADVDPARTDAAASRSPSALKP